MIFSENRFPLFRIMNESRMKAPQDGKVAASPNSRYGVARLMQPTGFPSAHPALDKIAALPASFFPGLGFAPFTNFLPHLVSVAHHLV